MPESNTISADTHNNRLSPGPIFITGVPGFIGSRLLMRLLDQHADVPARCLVEPRMMSTAEDWLEELDKDKPDVAQRVELLEGDITEDGCGLNDEDHDKVVSESEHVYHLAAIYDLTMPRDVGVRVNVDGTRNMLELAEEMSSLQRFNYASTCFVAGKRTGLVMEDELDEGQLFKNYYEETKFLAEVEVRRKMPDMSISIYRPAIVVGDSETGETAKFDGPYFAFRALLMGLMPVRPGAARAFANIVPVDFVTDAIAEISMMQGVDGTTFQLCDPDSPRARDVLDMAAERLGVRRPMFSVPSFLFDLALRIPALSRTFGVPREALDYFDHLLIFDSQNTQRALAETDVSCPPFEDYVNNIIAFFKRHAELPWRVA